MADSNGQRQRGPFHVAKSVWDVMRSIAVDIFAPIDLASYEHRPDHHCNNSNLSALLPRTGVERKYCPGCYRFKDIGDFFSPLTTAEWSHCIACRNRGKGGELTFDKTKLPSADKKIIVVRKTRKKKGPSFSEVDIEDDLRVDPKATHEDPLLDGEKIVTWERLSRTKRTTKTLKNVRKKRRRRRKNKNPPWRYSRDPASRYEELLRLEYENLWRQGRDECIPLPLVDQRSWMAFWVTHSQTDVAKKNLAKERERRASR